MTKQESIEAYNDYIDTHIKNVRISFERFGKALCEKLNLDMDRLKALIDDHDKSKYSKEEFEGYRKRFYKCDEDLESDEEIQAMFDEAWMHHLKNNAHHPEFWVNNEEHTIYIMNGYHIAEMLLDWCAMGIAQHEEIPVYDYWTKGDGTKKPFRLEVIRIIDNCVDIFKNNGIS